MKKTVENSSFRPEQEVKVKGIDFLSAGLAIDGFIDNMKAYSMPLRYKWIDNDGEPVENPTVDQQKDLKRVFDPHRTYNPNNVVESFVFKANNDEELQYEFHRMLELIEAKRRLFEIHHNEVEKGNTVLIEELMAEMNQPRTEIVE